jgi:hypothetical protein
MAFSSVNNFELKEDSAQVELNSAVNNKLKNGRPTEDVEIFSKIVFGKDTSKYGKKVDTVLDAVKNMSNAADNGDAKAKAEINSIITVTLQQPLMQRLSIANVLGNARTVGYNEDLKYEYYQIQAAELSRIQASSGSFTFPTVKKRTGTADTQTSTGGIIIDYRELASGATDGLAMASEQVLTDMTNQVVLSHINALRTAIIAATTLKNYAAGITQTNVDAVKNKARRFGNVTIIGDYSAVDKLTDNVSGFNVASATATEVRFSEAVMEEIMRTGLLKNYKGTPIVETPNTYNMTQLNTAGDFYMPYLPTTDLWFIPQGQLTPLQMVTRGGLTSMTATDVNLRAEVTRWDLEFGNKVIAEYIPLIGYIYDVALAE